jgi:PKD repeat protein
MRREINKKIAAFGLTVLLIALIFFVLTPPSTTAVYLHPGTPSPTSVNTPSTVTFNNINLTIRGLREAIPVTELNFSIRQSSNNLEVAYVKFSITGAEISDPLNKFVVTNITNTANLPYQPSGGFYGYDERTGANYTFGYGYGYSTTADLNILYKIIYTTSTTGTFYGRLYVNSGGNAIYASGSSTTFTVSRSSQGGGGTGGYPTARTGGPYTGVVGTPILFDGSGSTAYTGTTISSYTWVFGDGTTGVGIKSSHTYLTAGTYTVRLTVADNTGAAHTATTTATITSVPTTPTVTVTSQTLQAIQTAFGVTLPVQFYASDTNGDGKVDTFTDPNHVLTTVGLVNISGHL